MAEFSGVYSNSVYEILGVVGRIHKIDESINSNRV